MSTGWRYSVQVPDFTKEERRGEEIVVYYQVDVLVLAPGTAEPAPPTTVWRRYSEFRQLHANLKGAFPDLFKRKELEPPAKKSLRFVNNNDRLLHERRQQLETWLWNLLSHNEIATSRFMKVFLQLNLVARAATASSTTGQMSIRDGNEEDETPDTSSEVSAPSAMTSLSNAMTDVHTPVTGRFSVKAESMDNYRMGLRVEQRRELKELMKVISKSLDEVSLEAQDARRENAVLKQENRSLENQIASLDQIIKDGRFSQDEKYEELCKTLEEREKTLKKSEETTRLAEEALGESKRRCESLESEIEALRKENAANVEKHLMEQAVLESRVQSHAVAHARADQELLEARQKARKDNRLLAEAVKNLRQELENSKEQIKNQEEKLEGMCGLQGRSVELESEREKLKKEVDRLREELDTSRAIAISSADASKSQLDDLMRTHGLEVKSLRDEIRRLREEGDRPSQEEVANSGEIVQVVLRVDAGEEAKSAVSQLEVVNDELCKQLEELRGRINGTEEDPSYVRFCDLVAEVHSEVKECYTSSVDTAKAFSPEEVAVAIGRIADSNGKLQLLQARVKGMETDFDQDGLVKERLLSSVTSLLLDFIQKCKDTNEMKIDSFLSRPAAEPPVKTPDDAEEEEAQSATPTMKMLFGGLGAKMSQGSQGFMSFMQRGTPSSDNDQISVSRRAEQQ